MRSLSGTTRHRAIQYQIHYGTQEIFDPVLLHIIFVIPLIVNDVNLSIAFSGVSGLSSEERREKNFS
jgi:hypothetical protein